MAASTQTVELNVKGMDCADCALHVEHAVSALPGVARAQVLLMTERGIVEFDPARVDAWQIIRAVESVGDRASVVGVGLAAAAQSLPHVAVFLNSSRLLRQ